MAFVEKIDIAQANAQVRDRACHEYGNEKQRVRAQPFIPKPARKHHPQAERQSVDGHLRHENDVDVEKQPSALTWAGLLCDLSVRWDGIGSLKRQGLTQNSIRTFEVEWNHLSGCSSVRLERTVRDREVGGSNPPTPTTVPAADPDSSLRRITLIAMFPIRTQGTSTQLPFVS